MGINISDNKSSVNLPVPGEQFTYENGGKNQIVTVATHSITKEKLVIYQQLYGKFGIIAVPMDVFYEKNNKENVADVNKSNNIKIEDYRGGCPEGMNLLLYVFLEADTVRDRLKLVRDSDNRKYIDDKCIDDMAASIDVTIDEGDIDERIRQLITCLDTMKRFEVFRR